MQESPEFNKRLFESAINSIKTIAANNLWQVEVTVQHSFLLGLSRNAYMLLLAACGGSG